MLFLIYLLSFVWAVTRPPNVYLEQVPTWSDRVEDYVTMPNKIRLVINKPKNNGFYVKTNIELWQVNTRHLIDNVKSQLVFYPTMGNNSAFYQEYTYTPECWHR